MGKRGAAVSRQEAERAKSARSRRSSAHWNVTMLSEWGTALTAVEDVAFLQSQWRPAFELIADKLAEKTAKSFSSGSTPDGKSWRPIGDDYASAKGSRAHLYLSGKLRSAAGKSGALKKITNTSLVWHIKSPYATTHQFGSRRNLSKGKHGGFHGARARAYLIWGDDLKELFKNTINDYGRSRREAIMGRAGRGGCALH